MARVDAEAQACWRSPADLLDATAYEALVGSESH